MSTPVSVAGFTEHHDIRIYPDDFIHYGIESVFNDCRIHPDVQMQDAQFMLLFGCATCTKQCDQSDPNYDLFHIEYVL